MNISTINLPARATTGQLESKYFETDVLYADLSDLVNDQFKAWYCRKFFTIGRDRILILASLARADGKDAKKLFSHLLRKEAK